ncbi:hypothetical protein [Acidocella aminolytica]|uniref:Uncharacterized protein n=1 Tax=Acidocella aminolytica 101 = DSM 11237 TaxID=1120923 RepID=A0A0D6PEK6_9PROT|nr:hypothetical protein [Acidocella aminolytica]GAN79786.1 hypothetical protein Aam_030_019 [Acidocella aminolytica 101 = DSM 11237]GBQ32048.1 hypothetical protein AA11237_0054 [Acidocella aminolytica 101 = DSM 11237]SHF35609.1 hypothetical protein SAMN02746095_02946 [Acidocella aminolytica 101 = DSM 11237]
MSDGRTLWGLAMEAPLWPTGHVNNAPPERLMDFLREHFRNPQDFTLGDLTALGGLVSRAIHLIKNPPPDGPAPPPDGGSAAPMTLAA